MTHESTDPSHTTVDGGGAESAPKDPRLEAVRTAASKLRLLSEQTRETVLDRMDPAIAEDIRRYLASMPERPHTNFSSDLAERRRLLHDTANRIQKQRIDVADREMNELTRLASSADASARTPTPNSDPLDQLRDVHPAAIARAMQGERAEAWAIVLDHLDNNSKAALQLYLDPTARTAIEDARARQAELANSSPALLATVVAAIARTVVPRALREHHQLLSTTPLTWSGQTA